MTNDYRKIEVRLFGALLSLTLASNMVIDALWMLSQETVISKVARLSSYPLAMSAWWMMSAALVVPYFLMQVLGVFGNHHRPIVRLACRAIVASGVLYAYLGFLSRNLDYQYVTGSFVVMSFLNMGMAAALAHGLNAAQIRKEEELGVVNMTEELLANVHKKDAERRKKEAAP